MIDAGDEGKRRSIHFVVGLLLQRRHHGRCLWNHQVLKHQRFSHTSFILIVD